MKKFSKRSLAVRELILARLRAELAAKDAQRAGGGNEPLQGPTTAQRMAILSEILKERKGKRRPPTAQRVTTINLLAQAGVAVPRFSDN